MARGAVPELVECWNNDEYQLAGRNPYGEWKNIERNEAFNDDCYPKPCYKYYRFYTEHYEHVKHFNNYSMETLARSL